MHDRDGCAARVDPSSLPLLPHIYELCIMMYLQRTNKINPTRCFWTSLAPVFRAILAPTQTNIPHVVRRHEAPSRKKSLFCQSRRNRVLSGCSTRSRRDYNFYFRLSAVLSSSPFLLYPYLITYVEDF